MTTPVPPWRRARAYQQIRERVYDQIPSVECKGLCADSCTVIDASELERQAIADAGVELPTAMTHRQNLALIARGTTPRCPALGPLNTCTVYEVRPVICRLWGVAEGMRCEHGCIPDAIIRKPDALRALREVEELSEHVTGVSRVRGHRRDDREER